MKSASPALTAALLNIQDRVPGSSSTMYIQDLFCFLIGVGQIVVNQSWTPSGGSATVVPPQIGTATSVFAQDLGVKQAADYSPLVYVTGSPAIGQYTVNNSTGVYAFNASDTGAKLITYAFGNGIVAPTFLFVTSGPSDIQYGSVIYHGTEGPFLDRAKVRTSIGLEVSHVDLMLRATPSMQLPVNNVPIIQGFQQGYMDGAAVLVQRLISVTGWQDISLGTIIQFKGTVGDIGEIGRAHVKFEVRSRLELLNTMMPRNLILPGCRHALYDPGCTLVANNFAVSGTVQAGSNASQILTALTQPSTANGPTAAPSLSLATPTGVNLNERTEFVVVTYVNSLGESLPGPKANINVPGKKVVAVASPPAFAGATGWNCYIGNAPGDEMLQNAAPISIGTNFQEPSTGATTGSPIPELATNGYFSLGVVYFTSGVNAGLSRLISLYTPGVPPYPGTSSQNVFVLQKPLPNQPTSGDSFIAIPGCDRRYSTCNLKFNNLIHFGGEPWIPDPTLSI